MQKEESGNISMVDTKFSQAFPSTVEIHSSSFGVSGFYLQVLNSSTLAVGSTVSKFTGIANGVLHCNNAEDLCDVKYHLNAYVDNLDVQILFYKIQDGPSSTAESSLYNDLKEKARLRADGTPAMIFRGRRTAESNSSDNSFAGICKFGREEVSDEECESCKK